MKSLFLLLAAMGLAVMAHAETIVGSHTETVMITSSTVVKDWEIEYSTSGVTSFKIQGKMVSPQEFADRLELKHTCPPSPKNPFWLNHSISTVGVIHVD